jgi:hypothetical protein
VKTWLSFARQKNVVVRAAKTSILVGTILVLINQGEMILEGWVSLGLIGKIVLIYLVPYGVSTYAGVTAIRDAIRNQTTPL